MRLCGGKDENDLRRRFFECFQQRVEGARRKHVHFIDYVNLIFGAGRDIDHLFPDLPDIFHAVVGCRIYFKDVKYAPVKNTEAYLAFIARIAVCRRKAVDRPGQHMRHRSLACPPRSAEEVSM